MATTRTIEIDFEVHKAIEQERRSFDEPENAALRRLIGIDSRSPDESAMPAAPTTLPRPEGRPWVGKGKSTGLILPHGTELVLDYNGQRFSGQVDNGSLVFEGRAFPTPSAAARELCRTRDGRQTFLNGKELIRVRLPESRDFVLLKTYEITLRRKAKAETEANPVHTKPLAELFSR